MRNEEIDLCLFGEEADCAAEQSCHDKASVSAEGESEEKSENVFERIAHTLGIAGADEESLMREINKRKARAALEEMLKRRSARRNYKALISEAEGLSSKIKGFDLKAELQNPSFAALIRAGFSLEDAFKAVHVNELLALYCKRAEEAAVAKALERLREAGDRPDENGKGARAPAKTKAAVEALSSKGIRDILRRVENGQKIRF